MNRFNIVEATKSPISVAPTELKVDAPATAGKLLLRASTPTKLAALELPIFVPTTCTFCAASSSKTPAPSRKFVTGAGDVGDAASALFVGMFAEVIEPPTIDTGPSTPLVPVTRTP